LIFDENSQFVRLHGVSMPVCVTVLLCNFQEQVIQYRKKRLILVERFGRNGLWQCRVADRADACMNVDLSMEGVCLSGTRRERGGREFTVLPRHNILQKLKYIRQYTRNC